MNRALIAVPAALIVSASFLFAAAGPAMAADTRCMTLPAQVRDVASTAEPKAAKKALRFVAVGEKLCEAGNARAGVKKFAIAMQALGASDAQQLAALKR